MRNIFNEGWGIGVVLPLGHAFSGEPGNGISGSIMMFERSFKLLDGVGEGSNGDDSIRDSVVSESGCPSEG